MELLVRLSGLWFLICSAGTSADANGSKVKVKVKEGSDVMLPCSIRTNIESKLFDWRKDGQKNVFLYDAGLHSNNGLPGQDEEFKGRVSHFEDELKSGNASILIRNTKVTDSGDYTCGFPRLQPSGRIFYIELVVEPKVKVIVEEDSDVMLPCSVSTNIESKVFDWMKDGQKEVFQYNAGVHSNNGLQGQNVQFKGRVSHFEDELKSGNASILIRNTKVADSGDYKCVFPHLQPSGQIFYVQLVVEPKVKVIVIEDSDVMLPCSVSTNIESKVFDWNKHGQKEVFRYVNGSHSNNGLQGQNEQFKGRVSHFEDELKSGNASILIRNTKVADSGVYTCVFPHLQPSGQIFYVQLVVGVPSEPSIKILNKTTNWWRLQCSVRGASTKPELEWQDSAGNILHAKITHSSESGGRYNIVLQTTVNKTDHYRCVVTQKEICHKTHADAYVHLSGFHPGWIVGVVAALLVGVGVGGGVVFAILRKRYKKGRLTT